MVFAPNGREAADETPTCIGMFEPIAADDRCRERVR
jgi:hypothetical protein